ncbi:MAG: methyltransferase domain-containing protein, partial [Planctomycetota bacterium]|nr:methyltransferase domain-containing protein [Planctomycetota bacterium]
MSLISFHNELLADKIRLRAYSKGIAAVVKPGDRVIDLGTGTGILAFMAARAGAQRVYAIEKERIVNLARTLAAENGLLDRISFIRADFSKVSAADIGGKADVLISETLGPFGIHEQIVENYAHAARRLMKPDARYVPARLRLLLVPVTYPAGRRKFSRLSQVAGFDFRAAQRVLADSEIWVSVKSCAALARPRAVADFTLGRPVADTHSGLAARLLSGTEHVFTTTRTGRMDGYMGWFEAELAPSVVLSSRRRTHWPNLFLPLTPARRVARGSTIRVTLWVSK